MTNYDLLITNGRVVRPGVDQPEKLDIGVAGGTVAAVDPQLDASEADRVVDADGLLVFPGVVDAHQHWGIYNPLEFDADTESRAAAQGGVTSGMTYIRTGQYYLNKGGPYEEFMPEALERAGSKAYVDYAFHVAPMQRSHIDELDMLVDKFGVTSFKIFMFYGSHGLHGRSADQSKFLMTPPDESYDLAHFEFVMRGLQATRERHPDIADAISLSLHCETAEIMSAYTRMVEESGELSGLAAYHAARPPHSEGLAIAIASYLAHETGLPAINLLHLSSGKAIESATRMAQAFPHVDFRREVTIGHLIADVDTAAGIGGKVNPPIRPREDVEALWEAVVDGRVDWVVSDHACCRAEDKFGEPADDVFLAKSGFGGTEYLLSGLLTERARRGLSYGRIAELSAWNPAQRYGLWRKGTIAAGYDADLALVDPASSFVVRAEDSPSAQEYSPFEGMELSARVRHTFVRGQQVLRDGNVVGTPSGQYLSRPLQPAG